VDDIIFGGSSHALVVKFADTMSREFEMSVMGELTFFLRLQIKQTQEGTFVHQGKYTKDLLKKFHMSRDENDTDIFQPYSRSNPFRGVLIRPYPSPDI
jgi:hypothetical protein